MKERENTMKSLHVFLRRREKNEHRHDLQDFSGFCKLRSIPRNPVIQVYLPWIGSFLFQCQTVILVFVMAVSPVPAQNKRPVEVSLRVTVVDQAGAAIANARVTINKQPQT